MSFRSVLKGINPDRPLIELNENTIITSANLLKSLKKAKRNLEALGIEKIIIGHEANFENLYCFILALYTGTNIKLVSDIQNGSYPLDEQLKEIIQKNTKDLCVDVSNVNESFKLSHEYLSDDKEMLDSIEIELTTSGSSGKPKTILLDESDLIYQAETVSKVLNLNPNTRQLFYMPINYIYGLSIITTSILSNSCLVIPKNKLSSSKMFFNEIVERKITVFSGVPYTYNILAKWGAEKLKKSSLVSLTQAGGRLRLETKKKIHSLIGNIEFWVMYGQTEFGGRISQYKIGNNKIDEYCVGKPLEGIDIHIEFEENEEELGEIFINSPSSCKNIDEFVRTVEINGNKYYSTGDIGKLKDKLLYVSDRNKNFIKIGGSRISNVSIQNFFRDHKFIQESFICLSHGKSEKILIGVLSDKLLKIETQWELSEILDKNSELPKILENKPFEIFLLHGPLPMLDNGKPWLWKIFENLRNASIEKKSVHIWL